MADIAVTNTFANGGVADATQVNANFADIVNGLKDGTKTLTVASVVTAGVTNSGSETIAGSLAVTGDIYTKQLTDFKASYAPTGFTGTLYADECSYKLVGNMCHVWVSVLGISNAATLTFTLPKPLRSSAPAMTGVRFVCAVTDATSSQAAPGQVAVLAGSTTATASKALSASGGWTASGVKGLDVYLCYEIEPT